MILRVLLLVVMGGLQCTRPGNMVERRDGAAAAEDRGPRIKTSLRRTIGRFEERQVQARKAQRRRNAETERHGLESGIHTVSLDAASQHRFAQIWWAARYPHGQRPEPRIQLDRFTVRCAVHLSGEPEPTAGSDWTDFETTIDDLPPGRYRIIAPLEEVTLDVP